jgi:hypothetical protein
VRYSPSEFIKEPLPQGLTAVMVEDSIVNCEVTHTEIYEPQPSRMLTGDCLKRLAAELPDNDSWTEDELCKILKIEPQHVHSLRDSQDIYFIGISGKFCRNGCTPF